MRVGLIGSVRSSLLTLCKLVEYQFNIVCVWGYEPDSTINVSGYCSMKEYAVKNKLIYSPFVRVNNEEIKRQIRGYDLDILFIVGLSQLIDEDILRLPRYGCVGYHPTNLPHGRGRAPLSWLILREKEGAATFFKIDKGTDSGEIYVQERVEIEENDDAYSVADKLKAAMSIALDKWLPLLKKGELAGTPQNDECATYYARRAPLDGCIDWTQNAYDIDRLIKATTKPYPGAFSFYGDLKVIIWKSSYHPKGFPLGVIGRVVSLKANPVIQTGSGFVELLEYQFFNMEDKLENKQLSIGSRLGYYDQHEIFKIRNELNVIKKQIKQLLNEK
jgi:methionyl-tRNA formyltransferase